MRQRESNTPKPGRAGAPHASRTPPRMRLARCVIAVALLCASAESPAQPTRPHISLEYAVKATYLYKLAPFVNWPPRTFTAPNAPFQICIVGDDPFGDYLERAVAGHSLGAHPFTVRRLDKLQAGDDCQIAFIGRLSRQSLGDALAAVQGRPVLTVTDSNITDESGSIMQFVIENGRVRFDIDTNAAARNHLAISSKLLNLALAVKEER